LKVSRELRSVPRLDSPMRFTALLLTSLAALRAAD
jgi:hypothetical protein